MAIRLPDFRRQEVATQRGIVTATEAPLRSNVPVLGSDLGSSISSFGERLTKIGVEMKSRQDYITSNRLENGFREQLVTFRDGLPREKYAEWRTLTEDFAEGLQTKLRGSNEFKGLNPDRQAELEASLTSLATQTSIRALADARSVEKDEAGSILRTVQHDIANKASKENINSAPFREMWNRTEVFARTFEDVIGKAHIDQFLYETRSLAEYNHYARLAEDPQTARAVIDGGVEQFVYTDQGVALIERAKSTVNQQVQKFTAESRDSQIAIRTHISDLSQLLVNTGSDPATNKKFYDELGRLKKMVESFTAVYGSIAPDEARVFKGKIAGLELAAPFISEIKTAQDTNTLSSVMTRFRDTLSKESGSVFSVLVDLVGPLQDLENRTRREIITGAATKAAHDADDTTRAIVNASTQTDIDRAVKRFNESFSGVDDPVLAQEWLKFENQVNRVALSTGMGIVTRNMTERAMAGLSPYTNSPGGSETHNAINEVYFKPNDERILKGLFLPDGTPGSTFAEVLRDAKNFGGHMSSQVAAKLSSVIESVSDTNDSYYRVGIAARMIRAIVEESSNQETWKHFPGRVGEIVRAHTVSESKDVVSIGRAISNAVTMDKNPERRDSYRLLLGSGEMDTLEALKNQFSGPFAWVRSFIFDDHAIGGMDDDYIASITKDSEFYQAYDLEVQKAFQSGMFTSWGDVYRYAAEKVHEEWGPSEFVIGKASYLFDLLHFATERISKNAPDNPKYANFWDVSPRKLAADLERSIQPHLPPEYLRNGSKEISFTKYPYNILMRGDFNPVGVQYAGTAANGLPQYHIWVEGGKVTNKETGAPFVWQPDIGTQYESTLEWAAFFRRLNGEISAINAYNPGY